MHQKEYKNQSLYEIAVLNDFELKERLYNNKYLKDYYFDNESVRNAPEYEKLSFHDVLKESPLSLYALHHIDEDAVSEIVDKALNIYDLVVNKGQRFEVPFDNQRYRYIEFSDEDEELDVVQIGSDNKEHAIRFPGRCFNNKFDVEISNHVTEEEGYFAQYSVYFQTFDETITFEKHPAGMYRVTLEPTKERLGILLIGIKDNLYVKAIDADGYVHFSRYFFEPSEGRVFMDSLICKEVVREHISSFNYNLFLPIDIDYHIGRTMKQKIINTPIEMMRSFVSDYKSDYENITTKADIKFDNQMVITQHNNVTDKRINELVIVDNQKEHSVTMFSTDNNGHIKYDLTSKMFTFKKYGEKDFKLTYGFKRDSNNRFEGLLVFVDFVGNDNEPYHIELPLRATPKQKTKN